MRIHLVILLQTILLARTQDWRESRRTYRVGRGYGEVSDARPHRVGRAFGDVSDARFRELERLAKVTRDTDSRVVEWGRVARGGEVQSVENTVAGQIQGPPTNFYPSRREQYAKKKKKPMVQTTTTTTSTTTTLAPKVDETKTTDRQVNRYHEKVTPVKPGGSPTTLPPAGSSESTPKPTKYHYYPHNQHIYLLPECAIQQVCNAVYVRLNYTQPLCACPSRKEPCSASINTDDQHTTELATTKGGKILTLAKTCEPVTEMRVCRAPRDWSLLALQNIRTGKSHYLVICRCPENSRLEGPMSHDQPAYASVPGIRVYGMMCIRDTYRGNQPFRTRRSTKERRPPLPWVKIEEFTKSAQW